MLDTTGPSPSADERSPTARRATPRLPHGFPSSSFMFRGLIDADRYRVVAPDLIGFGASETPPASEFDYTFDALAAVTADLLDQLGLDRFAIYVQDIPDEVRWHYTHGVPRELLDLLSPDTCTCATCPTPNCTCSMRATSPWRPTAPRSPSSSVNSCRAPSPGAPQRPDPEEPPCRAVSLNCSSPPPSAPRRRVTAAGPTGCSPRPTRRTA
ncbi:hypothetical protein GCM10009609_50100 [Pseudonocardia aurantiaca]